MPFEVTCRKMLCSDPCYAAELDPILDVDRGLVALLDVKNGTWNYDRCDGNAQLVVWHESVTRSNVFNDANCLEADSLGVDSGMFGFYDFEGAKEFFKTHSWDEVCNIVFSTTDHTLTFAFGHASGTLYGDGSYPPYSLKNAEGEIVGLRVNFNPDEFED